MAFTASKIAACIIAPLRDAHPGRGIVLSARSAPINTLFHSMTGSIFAAADRKRRGSSASNDDNDDDNSPFDLPERFIATPSASFEQDGHDPNAIDGGDAT